MAGTSSYQPLIANGEVEQSSSKSPSVIMLLLRWGLKSLMWAIFIIWVVFLFLLPTQFGDHLFAKIGSLSQNTVYGFQGTIFLIFSAPILIIAVLAYLYIIISSNLFVSRKKSQKFPRFRLWTFPVLVDGPFGVVSAGELVGIVLFVAFVLWLTAAYAVHTSHSISRFTLRTKEHICLMLEFMGFRFGSIGLYCVVFLFLPISRGSVLLRLIDIPFEHATRYHVWLGHLTMAIFSLHGLFYMIAWSLQGRFAKEMLAWQSFGIANLPGVISLLAGLFMWVTSLHPVRKNYFELFFYTHQLYVIFVMFLAMHVGDTIFTTAAGALFLFTLDRFLRFCQSRNKVDIISATCRPCGTIELIFSKPASLRYNALSFLFVQVRELSWLQWHPFSVSSSPMEGRNHISVLIKVLGEWTEKLGDLIRKAQKHPQVPLGAKSYKLTASVEGPYGHEVAYHLKYENLILVAGGIGISPFLAIISDILHRIKGSTGCLPKNVFVVWAVKKSKELSLLDAVDSQSICPHFHDKLNLDIQAYVTQECEPSIEEGKLFGGPKTCPFSVTNGGRMSSLVGTGDNIWSGLYFFVSLVGFFVIVGLLEVFYIKPYGIYSWWYKGLLFSICMVSSVVVFGGIVVFLWHLWEKRNPINGLSSEDENPKLGPYDDKLPDRETSGASLSSVTKLRYGCRPNFREIFTSFAKLTGRADVGVIVCGPPGLQGSVAKECRTQNIRGRWDEPVFHFHSHSFDL